MDGVEEMTRWVTVIAAQACGLQVQILGTPVKAVKACVHLSPECSEVRDRRSLGLLVICLAENAKPRFSERPGPRE